MCFGNRNRESNRIPTTVDFGAMEEALLASPQMQAGFDIERAVPPATEPDVLELPPVEAAESEAPGEVIETMEIIVIGSGPMPLGLVQLLSGLLESEPGAVELGPMDTFPFRA
jgi:hypothetical protein